ncbi:hypothetical protein O181_016442 [Austropuccinia psidii MF-1]|uniref:Uncharacterized protein n=1 Tax=Austropuccinia psidii MF-1 TaxID=1389203 RepID=A0A9Q3GRP2_9BASI|nr:hypothetical protein [Austropuccinia psidii MF-1]
MASLSIASSGPFNPSQTYDSYKAVEILDPACNKCLAKGKDCFEHYNPRSSKCHYCNIGKNPCHQTGRQNSNVRSYLWSKKVGNFGKEFPVSEAPTPDANSEYSALTGSRQRDVARWTNDGGLLPVGGRPLYTSSEVPISRINNEGVVKQIRIISDCPPDPDSEGSDEIDGEEAEVVPHSVVIQSILPLPILQPRHSRAISSTIPPETSSLLFPPFLLPHPTLPTPGMPQIKQ